MARPRAKAQFTQFTGGLDVVSPMVSIPAGFLRDSQNVEEDINGGYASISGIERFDGQTAPSSVIYYSLPYTAAGTVAVGNTITGATSGATAVVIAITATVFVVTKVTGTWGVESTTIGGASVVGPISAGGFSGAADAQYTSLAANVYRAAITTVPGAGSVLGVWYYKGVVYAFRNNVGAGVGMYKATSLGWTAVNLNYQVSFSNANASVVDGATLTQGAVTATILRVVVETGTLASGTNTGRLIISSPVGGSLAAGAATSTGGGAVTLSGAQAAITIPNKNGRYSFVNYNFYGQANTLRMYGCDGQNYGFEFDGTVYVPIHTGNTVDAPTFVAAHQKHLFFAFGSAAQNSGIGAPYNWTALAGAAETDIGDTITGFMSQPGGSTTAALAIYSRGSTDVLYGTSSANWQKIPYSNDAGAIPYSIQRISDTYVLNNRGIESLTATLNFGNFTLATISRRISTWLATRRKTVTDSHVARDKQQYRLFFSDGSAAYCTMRQTANGIETSITPIQFPASIGYVTCSSSQEEYLGGEELKFIGSSNGYVYQMERGTSFDNDSIDWYMDLVYDYSKMYRALKKYRRLTFELYGDGYSVFSSTYALSYSSTETAQPNLSSNEVSLSEAKWDEFVWDEFVWDGVSLMPLSMAIDGDGENISVRLQSTGNYYSKLRFSGYLLEFTPLRMLR